MVEAFEPDWAVPPGVTIAAILKARSMSREAFASALGENVETVQRLLFGLETVDGTLAERLSACLGSSRNFWMSREAQYRADSDRIREREKAAELESWVRGLPARDMANLGWIRPFRNRQEAAERCLGFFGLPDVGAWQARYSRGMAAAAFRISGSAKNDPGAVSAWLRWAELVAGRVHCAAWDPDLFRERIFSAKALTWQKDPAAFLPRLRALCAEAGVAVVVARTPTGCPVSGATQFLTPHKALLALSFRYRSDDQFWFTFYHEAAHLLLHEPGSLFLEGGEDPTLNQEEQEANDFASSVIVPDEHRPELLAGSWDQDALLRFARRLGVAPGLIVGQLQHFGRVGQNRLNWLKRRYSWDQIEADRLIP